MPRYDHEAFIALWQSGLPTAVMASRLGIPLATVISRAHALQRRGQLAKRPMGGAHPPLGLTLHARTDGGAPPGAPQGHERASTIPDQPPVSDDALRDTVEWVNDRVGGLERVLQDLAAAMDRVEHRLDTLEAQVPRGMPPIALAPGQHAIEERLSALEARAWQTPTPEHAMEPVVRPKIAIYALMDPRTHEVRYVGQSVTPKARFKTHRDTRGEAPAREAWIASLQTLGQHPTLEILEEVDVDHAVAREIWWIDHYRSQGAILFNRHTPVLHPNWRMPGGAPTGGTAPALAQPMAPQAIVEGAPLPPLLAASPSHRVKVSMRDALREALQAEAARQTIDPSKIVQQALEAWLNVKIPEH